MSQSESQGVKLQDAFFDACDRLEIDEPAKVCLNIMPDSFDPGWDWVEVTAADRKTMSEQERRTLGAVGLALFKSGFRTGTVEFPIELRVDRVSARVQRCLSSQLPSILG